MSIDSAPPLWLINLVRAVDRHEQTHSHNDGDGECLALVYNQVPADIRKFADWAEDLVQNARAQELRATAKDVEDWIQSDAGGRNTVGDWLRLRAADIEEDQW